MSNKIDKNILIEAAMQLSREKGYVNVTRDEIAERAQVAQGTVTNLMGTMAQLKTTIVRHGVRIKDNAITSQAIVNRHPYVMKKLTKDQRSEILQQIS